MNTVLNKRAMQLYKPASGNSVHDFCTAVLNSAIISMEGLMVNISDCMVSKT